jgi:hypothetical protein
VFELINRPDVQSNIKLDLRQKNALAQYQQQSRASVQQQMQQMFQNMRGQRGQRGQLGAGGQPGQPGDQGQQAQPGRQDPAQRQQLREQIQAQRAEIQTKITAGLNDILKPEQVQRLHELDLQWRGALSMADSKVADEVQLTPEHRTAISGVVSDYQAKIRESRQQMMQQFRGNRNGFGAGQQPGAQGQQPAQANRANMANSITEMRRQEAAARKEAEDKALGLLSAEEKSRWTKAQGQPFTFRTDIQTLRQPGGF